MSEGPYSCLNPVTCYLHSLMSELHLCIFTPDGGQIVHMLEVHLGCLLKDLSRLAYQNNNVLIGHSIHGVYMGYLELSPQ